MHVYIAGGTGAIGRRLIPQLVARRHRVTSTTRDVRKIELIESLGAAGGRTLEPGIVPSNVGGEAGDRAAEAAAWG